MYIKYEYCKYCYFWPMRWDICTHCIKEETGRPYFFLNRLTKRGAHCLQCASNEKTFDIDCSGCQFEIYQKVPTNFRRYIGPDITNDEYFMKRIMFFMMPFGYLELKKLKSIVPIGESGINRFLQILESKNAIKVMDSYIERGKAFEQVYNEMDTREKVMERIMEKELVKEYGRESDDE